MSNFYGIELVVDASGRNVDKFNREDLHDFVKRLADLIGMNRVFEPFYWDEENDGETDDPHLKGVSMIQFIETSNITIHTLTLIKSAFFNIFSCKDFDAKVAEDFITEFFACKHTKSTLIKRNYVRY